MSGAPVAGGSAFDVTVFVPGPERLGGERAPSTGALTTKSVDTVTGHKTRSVFDLWGGAGRREGAGAGPVGKDGLHGEGMLRGGDDA